MSIARESKQREWRTNIFASEQADSAPMFARKNRSASRDLVKHHRSNSHYTLFPERKEEADRSLPSDHIRKSLDVSGVIDVV